MTSFLAPYMTQASTQTPLNHSRLAQLLAGMGVSGVRQPRDRFTERLGRLTDLADSVRIAAAHRFQPDEFAPAQVSAEDLREEFMRARGKMVESVVQRLAPSRRQGRLKPPPGPIGAGESASACEPYLKFYAGRQADLDFQVRNLQLRIRDIVGNISPELARLVALDKALGEALASYHRRCLAKVPTLVEPHFRRRLENAAHDPLFNDMRALLLAEIETRLLPVIGLVEAAEDHLNNPGSSTLQ